MIYIVLGAPGVGKGTRAKLMCEKLGIPHISTGSLIRESEEITEKYNKILGEGNLLPDEAIKEMLIHRLKKSDVQKGFVLDGYPRTMEQVYDLEEILSSENMKITKVFLFEAAEQEIYDRILNRRICIPCDKIYGWGKGSAVPSVCEKCGRPLTKRAEDNIESIKTRLEVYYEKTMPIIAHYEKMGLLERIDSTDNPERVLERV